jgi:hypothetical protein
MKVKNSFFFVERYKLIILNKGNSKDPKNYKSFTLMTYLGKVFTGILNNRLASLSDEFGLLSSFSKNICHRPTLHIVSNALPKSMKVKNSFFFVERSKTKVTQKIQRTINHSL